MGGRKQRPRSGGGGLAAHEMLQGTRAAPQAVWCYVAPQARQLQLGVVKGMGSRQGGRRV